MSEQQRRRFDAQFKHDALRLAQESNRKISDAADPEHAFPGKGYMKPDEEYVRRLERELLQARVERDILKKALAYFSRTNDEVSIH